VAQHGSINGSLGSGGRSLHHQKHEEVHRVFHELRAQQLGCRWRHVRQRELDPATAGNHHEHR